MKSLFYDNRMANILQFFSKTSVISINTLASKLDVSERTVRNDIKQLNKELEKAAIIDGDKGKFYLRIFDAAAYRKIYAKMTETEEFLNSSRNRMDYAFGKLMRNTEPILTDDLAYEMNVGRTTLVSDMKKLREEIAPYDLSLIGKTSKGMLLCGEEIKIRKYVLENNYYQIYRQYPLDQEVLEQIRNSFSQYEFPKNLRKNLEKYITLMLDRFLTGHFIGRLTDRYYNLTSRKEFSLVDTMINEIAKTLHIEIPVEEKLFVFLPIIGMRLPTDIKSVAMIELDEAMADLLVKILERIDLELNIRIDSGDFEQEFLYHLMFMMNRLRFGVKSVNPLLEEIKEKYPLAYQMAGVAGDTIREESGLMVSEDEKGYLAAYFGVFLSQKDLNQEEKKRIAVVCGTGRVTAHLVAVQLKKILKDSYEFTLLAEGKVSTELLNQYDIILTTVDISCNCNRPIIRINEIFDEQELIRKLEKAKFWEHTELCIMDNNWFVMAGMLDERRYFRFEKDCSYPDAVDTMVDRLTQDGYLDEKFGERLMEREEKGTMAFDHLTAIPHSIQYESDHLELAIGIFDTPVIHQDMEIQFIFLLGLPEMIENDESVLIRVYDEIINITQDSEMLEKMAKAKTYTELIRVLYK